MNSVSHYLNGWQTVFRPFAQAPSPAMMIAVRTAGDPMTLTPDVRRAVAAVDPVQPVFDLMTMRRMLYEKTIGLQFVAAVMGIFALLALILAVLGLYAVMSYVVAQRTHEIGVRIALGATAADVTRLALRQAVRLTAVGVAIGFVLAIALGRAIEAGLFGVISNDARLSAAIALALAAAAFVAAVVPARRAAATDPIDALRAE